MSVTRSYGKEEIAINENVAMIIETKEEEGYEWKEITYKSDKSEFYIGAYSVYNYSCSQEWMEYNENYIVLLIIHKGGHENSETEVKKIFDINSGKLIEGSKEQLLDIYRKNFKEIAKNKVLTKK